LATLPILIIGFVISDEFLAFLRMPKVIATATGVFGILLWWTDRTFEGSQKLDKVNAKGFLFIGLMQVIALIPGTSRSGITITAGRVLGINRTEATRFSFLLAIPTIGASIVWQGLEFINTTQVVEWNKLFIAVILSALSSWLSIALFLKFIQLIQFSWFMGYRLFLAGLTFIVL